MKINTVQSMWLRFLQSLPDVRWHGRNGLGAAIGQAARPRVILLQGNELVRLEKNSGVKCIRVQHGSVWLTGTPAAADVLLRPGDEFDLNNSWPYLLQPLLSMKAKLELIS